MKIIQINLDLNEISNNYITKLIKEKIQAKNEDNKEMESVISNEKNKLTLILPSVFRYFIGDVEEPKAYLGIKIDLKTIYSHIDFNKAYLMIHDKFLSNQYYLNGTSNLTYKKAISLNIKDNEFCLISSDPFATIMNSNSKSVISNDFVQIRDINPQVISFEDEKKNIELVEKERVININDLLSKFTLIKKIKFASLSEIAKKVIERLGNTTKLELYLNSKNFEFVDGNGKDIAVIGIYKDDSGEICYSCNASRASCINLREDIESDFACEIDLKIEIPKYFFTNHATYKKVYLPSESSELPKKIRLETNKWIINGKEIEYGETYDLGLYTLKVEKQ